MAAKKAGSVVINLSAGTAAFVADMERAKGKVVDFGAASKRMGDSLGHSVSQVQATSGALRVLEGGLNNNLRAAERFTANVLGLGPLLQKAFPVIGAVAFTGLLVKMGEEAYKLEDTLCMPENLVSQLYESVVLAVPREFVRSLLGLLQETNAALNHAEMIGRLRSRVPADKQQVN